MTKSTRHELKLFDLIIMFVTVAVSQNAVSNICLASLQEVIMNNDKLAVHFCPARGDHPQQILAKQVDKLLPFDGSLNSGPLFANKLTINGKSVQMPAARVVKQSQAGDSEVVVFNSNDGPLEIIRRYTMRANEAGYHDESTLLNTGSEPLELHLGAQGDVAGRKRPEPDVERWAWPVMRWYLPQGDLMITRPVFWLQDELQNNKKPLCQVIRHREGPFWFGYANNRALGLLVRLDLAMPIKFRAEHDRFRDQENGNPVRLKEFDTQWSWQAENPVILKPGDSVTIKRHVMLLNGQVGIDTVDPSGLAAYMDVPPYRDPGERIEVAVCLASDRERNVKVSLLMCNGDETAAEIHPPQTIKLSAGRTRNIVLDVARAVAPKSRLTLLVEEADTEPLRIEKTVSVGTSTSEGQRLAKEYRRKFPVASDFRGTLRELGQALITPRERLRVADGFPPDVQLRYWHTATDAAERLTKTYDLSDAA